MHADLLILSETEDGLTECLQRLNRYSHKWKMTISTKKTKIMIFNKSGRMIRIKIRVGEQRLSLSLNIHT